MIKILFILIIKLVKKKINISILFIEQWMTIIQIKSKIIILMSLKLKKKIRVVVKIRVFLVKNKNLIYLIARLRKNLSNCILGLDKALFNKSYWGFRLLEVFGSKLPKRYL